jgi:glycerophosphoryl diester phosphodiesterase
MRILILSLSVTFAASAAGCASAPASNWPHATLGKAQPLVIAHRGASGVRPEHTIEAYRTAIAQGADCIEPDLVMTKDGVLVARHDIYLSSTTDIASRPEFASRKRASPDPGHPDMEDWWVVDFTLAELKTLRAVQPFRGRPKSFDGQFDVPTFDEVLALAKASRSASGKPVCVYPEAKAPAFHASLGLPMAQPILDALKRHGMDAKGSPVFIQTFEPPFAKQMSGMTELPVVMLVGDRESLDAALALEGRPFWDGLGATHGLLIGADGKSTGVLEASHSAGIPVHAWTYRDDTPMMPGGTMESALRATLAMGLDGFFTDFPESGVRVVAAMGDDAKR